MPEPTDDHVAAFHAGWEAEDEVRGVYRDPKPGDRTRAGLRAVFALLDDKLSDSF